MGSLCLSSGDRVCPASRQVRLVLLPPPVSKPGAFPDVIRQHRADSEQLIASMQRLRGRIYLEDNAIEASALREGRHQSPADAHSWHVLMEDSEGEVKGCVRAQIHHPAATNVSKLMAYNAALAMDPHWGTKFKGALRAELELANSLQIRVLEIGGLALDESIRGTSAVVKMVLAIYSLASSLGGAVGISTVTSRHRASSILRRLGGQSLEHHGDSLPPYYDPQYHCEMEILKFYSWAPSHHHHKYAQPSHKIVNSWETHHHLAARTTAAGRRRTSAGALAAGAYA